VYQHLESGGAIFKVAGLRTLSHEAEPNMIYVNGEMFKIPEELTSFAELLSNQDTICLENSGESLTQNSAAISLITELVNKGYWFAE
jgi:50S ribosomal protein L16 3-hydroxylase